MFIELGNIGSIKSMYKYVLMCAIEKQKNLVALKSTLKIFSTLFLDQKDIKFSSKNDLKNDLNAYSFAIYRFWIVSIA